MRRQRHNASGTASWLRGLLGWWLMSPENFGGKRIGSRVGTDLLVQKSTSASEVFFRNQNYTDADFAVSVGRRPGGYVGLPVAFDGGFFANCGTSLAGTVQDHSVAAWVYIVANGRDNGFLCSRSGNIGAAGFEWKSNSAFAFAYFGGGSINGFYSSPTALATGKWVHACGTWDQANGVATFYQNGISLGTAATATATITHSASDEFHWGEQSGRLLDGYQDDMMVWNRVLLPGEIAALYQASLLGHPELLMADSLVRSAAQGGGAGHGGGGNSHGGGNGGGSGGGGKNQIQPGGACSYLILGGV